MFFSHSIFRSSMSHLLELSFFLSTLYYHHIFHHLLIIIVSVFAAIIVYPKSYHSVEYGGLVDAIFFNVTRSICTTIAPQVNCVRQVDFLMKGSVSTVWMVCDPKVYRPPLSVESGSEAGSYFRLIDSLSHSA